MKLCYYLILLCVCDVISAKKAANEEDELEYKRKRILEQLTRTQTDIQEGYHVVTRQISTDILKFRSYRSVTVMTYPIMHDTEVAQFNFQAEEAHMNSIGSCDPQDVIVDIKYSSYPAVNPDGYDFPEGFIAPSQREYIHSLKFLSDKINNTYIIENPRPGIWFAIAYIKWEDPKKEKVKQAGLVPSCQTALYSDLQVKPREGIEFIDCYSHLTWDCALLPTVFKCMTRDNNDIASFNVTLTNVIDDSYRISVRIQASTVPTSKHNIMACTFDAMKGTQEVTFSPSPSSWHYIEISYAPENYTDKSCESYNLRSEFDDVTNYTIVDLMRDDRGRFFTFNYGVQTSDLDDVTSSIVLDSESVTSVRFPINAYLDIGGTLTIGATILMSLKYYMGYQRPKDGAESGFDEDNRFFKVVVCLDIGHTSKPLSSGECQYNDKVTKALFSLNSTDTDTIFEQVIIPYPDAGMWYLTLRLFCDSAFCPCPTFDDGMRYYVGGNVTDAFNVDTWMGDSDCNATVLVSVESSACLTGKCANHGRCQLNTYGGLVMSYCACNNGYGAWDCSDRSRLDGMTDMMVAVFLLTLSNLLFFFSIYIAVIRRYYTEAIMYTFTMVFSTFYHACDAPDEISMCVFQINILQFGDFYCGLMSFWVTLLAMSVTHDVIKSSGQLVGAIVIALATTWNMHSIVSFLMPVAVGAALTFGSWGHVYWKTRRIPFPKSYFRVYLPIGVSLVSVGLLCYAFLQTESNYKLVHSFWHIIIALSVVFLLPDSRRTGQPNAFAPSPNFFKWRRARSERIASDSATGSDQTRNSTTQNN